MLGVEPRHPERPRNHTVVAWSLCELSVVPGQSD
jgi:hypothetical protein